MVPKSSAVTLILSMLPGLGHLYLGLHKRGLQFMAAFFGCIFMITQIPLLFSFVLPIIWFYSLFDALQLTTAINHHLNQPDQPSLNPFDIEQAVDQGNILDPIWTGIASIGTGIVVLLVTAFPELWRYLQERNIGGVLAALVLIGFGISMVLGHFQKKEKP